MEDIGGLCVSHIEKGNVPDYRKIPYIMSGYRLSYNKKACVKSLCQAHNETVNIWTHLVGCLIWMYMGYTHPIYYYRNGYPLGVVAFSALFFFGCVVAIGSSCLFHLMNCINYEYHEKLKQLDFIGISTTIIGCIWMVTYTSFYCYSFWFKFYTAVVAIMTFCLLSLPFSDFVASSRNGRALFYISGSLTPLVQGLHIMVLEGANSPLMGSLFFWCLIGYLCFGTGVALYAIRWPERTSPGTFDYIGHSHQLWHCLVVMGQYFTLVGGMNAFELIYQNPTCHHSSYL
eukprot:TRINITY_DN3890_c0_g1_i1.p1 TRINITY_DN3890_c0_g1~~TRINITY_DN3890_c0_g1_i1.p1  ORF type:complete len:287 (-),score=25.39 TRINITY_DN3890_c0_g1_i1:424-1284(-)